MPRPSFPHSVLGSSNPSLPFPKERPFPPVRCSYCSFADQPPSCGQPYPDSISCERDQHCGKTSRDYGTKTSSLHGGSWSYLVLQSRGRSSRTLMWTPEQGAALLVLTLPTPASANPRVRTTCSYDGKRVNGTGHTNWGSDFIPSLHTFVCSFTVA